MMFFVERLYKTVDGWKYGVYTFEDEVQAEKMFYKLLAADIDDETKIVSTLVLMDENGSVLMRKRFDHPAEPEAPEAEEA